MSDDKMPGWKIPEWVLKDTNLTAAEKIVMGIIWCLHRKSGVKCSNDYIATEAGTSVGAVRVMLVRLRKRGYLKPVEKTFPYPVDGVRLVPIAPEGVNNSNGVVTISNGGVNSCDIDSNYTLNNRRESNGQAVLDPVKYPEHGEKLISLVATRGVSRADARSALDWVIGSAAAGAPAPRNWPAYVHEVARRHAHQRANAERAAARASRRYVPPAAPSQFSKIHS